MSVYRRWYHPYVSPFDPCTPIQVKSYVVTPNLFLGYQPYGLPQFSPQEALKLGTLWPALFCPYEGHLMVGGDSNGVSC